MSVGYILVVEDDDVLRELLEIVLTEEGYEVHVASSAAEALDLVRQCQPALILFDVLLRDQHGAAFVECYRQLPDANAPLIAVSAMADLESEAARIGADDFLAKPFDLDDLLTRLERAIGAKPGE
jgi:two-component system phosphate regulon response regulator PhoB